jgi:hypothetical protein
MEDASAAINYTREMNKDWQRKIYTFYCKLFVLPSIDICFESNVVHDVTFGSTYACEQLFSRMKNVKSKVRTQLTEAHLRHSLRIASSRIKAGIDKSVK